MEVGGEVGLEIPTGSLAGLGAVLREVTEKAREQMHEHHVNPNECTFAHRIDV